MIDIINDGLMIALWIVQIRNGRSEPDDLSAIVVRHDGSC